MLSSDQFKGLANQLRTSGGFTVDVQTGEQPTSGVAVALPGAEETFKSASGSDLEGYATRRRGELTRPGAHMGGWASDRGDVIDASKVIPDHPGGHHMAEVHHAMHVYRQDAAYDITNAREIDNPRAPYDWRAKNNTWSAPDEYGSSVRLVKRNH